MPPAGMATVEAPTNSSSLTGANPSVRHTTTTLGMNQPRLPTHLSYHQHTPSQKVVFPAPFCSPVSLQTAASLLQVQNTSIAPRILQTAVDDSGPQIASHSTYPVHGVSSANQDGASRAAPIPPPLPKFKSPNSKKTLASPDRFDARGTGVRRHGADTAGSGMAKKRKRKTAAECQDDLLAELLPDGFLD